MKLKFIIIPSVVLLVIYMAFAQTSYINTIAMNISIGNPFQIFIDTTNTRVGINTSSPNSTLHVVGDVNFEEFKSKVVGIALESKESQGVERINVVVGVK